MTDAELADWIKEHLREPSGYPDGSVIWRINLSDAKVEQIVTALRRPPPEGEAAMWKERWEAERRDHEATIRHSDQMLSGALD